MLSFDSHKVQLFLSPYSYCISVYFTGLTYLKSYLSNMTINRDRWHTWDDVICHINSSFDQESGRVLSEMFANVYLCFCVLSAFVNNIWWKILCVKCEQSRTTWVCREVLWIKNDSESRTTVVCNLQPVFQTHCRCLLQYCLHLKKIQFQCFLCSRLNLCPQRSLFVNWTGGHLELTNIWHNIS